MKTLLYVIVLAFLSLQVSLSQWNLQTIKNDEINSKLSVYNYFLNYDESSQKLNYIIVTDYAYLVTFNSNNPEEQTYTKLNIDTSLVAKFQVYQNGLVNVISYKESLFFVCKNSLYEYKQDKLTKITVGDKYDRDYLTIPLSIVQEQRDFNLAFVSNGKLYFSCESNDISYVAYFQGTIMKQLLQSYYELFEYDNGKLNLLFTQTDGQNSNISLTPQKVNTYKNGFILSNFKINSYTNSFSLCYISDNKITNFEEHSQFQNGFNYVASFDFLETKNKSYALYGGDYTTDYKTVFKPSVVIYENEKPVDMFLLNNYFSGNGRGPERNLHQYKDNFFIATEVGFYYYNGKNPTLISIPYCELNGMTYLHSKTFINDKGIFILQPYPQKGLVYYKNTDELIAATGIEEDNSEDYFSILGNEIKFQKLPKNYLIYDLNGKVIFENSKPNQIEELPRLTTGTYFIFAQYGKQLIKNKFSILN